MTPLFKIFILLLIIIGSVYECQACEFGCTPWVDCMPCSLLLGDDGLPVAAGGWCFTK